VAGIASNFVAVPDITTSLSRFVLGGWVMGQFGNFLGWRQRGLLILSSIIQTILVFAVSGFQFQDNGSGNSRAKTLVVIALLALSAGGQVATARSLRIAKITTAYATSVCADTFIDVDLYKLES
jgi:hypothetical protein